VLRTWRQLPHERRLAAGAALALFATLFLPWYQDTVIAKGAAASPLQSFSDSLTGWGAFSFVEAAVLLVAAGVLVLLFIRANGGAFHVPGGDGGVILAAGVWTCVLVLWRIFDKEGSSTTHPQFVTSTGVEWGIFFALGVAGFLAYAGSRIKLVNEPEPPLPGEAPRSRSRSRRPRPVPVPPAPAAAPPRRRGPLPPEPPTLRAGDEPPTITSAEDEPPTIASRADEPPTIASGADEAPTVASTSDEPATRKLTRDDAPPPAGHPRPSRRRVEFPDLDEIEFEDPPTARLGRSAPAGRRRPEDGDGS
jgi:hypothetical protein